MKRLPPTGLSEEALFAQLEAYAADDLDWRAGRTFGYIYDAGRQVEGVAKRAFTRFLTENALDPTVYPSLLRIENDLLAVALSHLQAPEGAVGTFTSGGTESILLAVLSARTLARARGVTAPEMILPVTAHAAFHKAARYLDVTPVLVPVDPRTFKPEPAAMEAAITPNTALLVLSAPSYGHGVVDPVAEVAAVAEARGLPLHVDACVGGWLLPYFRRLGSPVPAFDFSLPGVTSISMDFHKYGYAPKGASVVCFRDKALRAAAYFACAQWTGYTVINTAVQSSRGGGPLAACWATVNYLGDEGYLEIARQMRDATQRLAQGIEAIDGLYLMASPEFCMFSFTSDTIHLYHLIDEMRQRQWYIQPQFGIHGHASNIHLSVHKGNVQFVEAFLADLAECAEIVRGLPTPDLMSTLAPLLGSLQGGLTPEVFAQLLGAMGLEGAALPERMAPINGLLELLPPELKEEALIAFLNELFVPAE
ncbi:MAG: aspartate aminotransferase family protein [Alphaproteobacteria bacterium]|nr:aspartate aminotransferase family protein [Alphaproteobacteria bacterium]